MAIAVFPAPSAGKTMFRTTLLSGTSYTVPAGVTYLNVTLYGGGGGAGGQNPGTSGQVVSSIVNTTPGASITYSIGAGGTGATGSGGAGGATTFTGATSAAGGGSNQAGVQGGAGAIGQGAGNGGLATFSGGTGGSGGAGKIDIEYWA